VVDPEVMGDAGGACGEADSTELPGLAEGEAPGFAEAVLQAAMLVVDSAEASDFVVEGAVKAHQMRVGGLGQVSRDAAGENVIEKVACSERFQVGSEKVFLETRELCEPPGEAGVVAESAEVAEMIGEALVLEGEGAEVNRPRGALNLHDGFESGTVGPGEGDGGVAGDSGGEAMCFVLGK
jgi:hypothetical protein